MLRTYLAPLTVLIMLLAPPAAGQGLYWESTEGGRAEVEKFFYMPGKFKVVSAGFVHIMRLDREVLYNLDPAKKTYMEMTFAEMEAMASQAGSAMEQMRKQMEGMPEEQRKMMEQMMGGMGGQEPPVSIRKTGEKKSISGHSCVKYQLVQKGEDVGTVWATTDIKGFESIRKDMEAFTKRMRALSPMNQSAVDEALEKIEGFPMETRILDDDVMVVTKLERRSIPAGEFEIPSGYTRVSQEEMMKWQEEYDEVEE